MSRKAGGLSGEEKARFTADLAEVARRLGELDVSGSGGGPKVLLPASSTVNSPFVSGLRGKTTGDGPAAEESRTEEGASDQKLRLLESVLQQLAVLDRVVLKKTAPEAVPGTNVAARRSSRGFDLHCIPTHLHLVDRLLDLHAQSKRVTVIRTSTDNNATPGPPAVAADSTTAALPSPRGAKLYADKIEKLNGDVARLSKQLEESEEKRRGIQEDCSAARREANTRTKELEALKRTAEEERGEAEQRWRRLLEEEQALTRALSEKIEAAASVQQSFISAILQRASPSSSCPHDGAALSASASASASASNPAAVSTLSALPSDASSALRLLDEAHAARARQGKEQLEALASVRDAIESELATQSAKGEMLQRDLEGASQELDALKGAYAALEMESAQRASVASASKDDKRQQELADKTISDLSADLGKAHRRIFDLEKVVDSVADIEARLRLAEDAKFSTQGKLDQALLEVDGLTKLTESLKGRLRDLSSRPTDREFLDSYEEVMRDEMLTMKSAFESKIRLVKEEAEAASRRHNEMIKSLSTERLKLAKTSSTSQR